jgi:hypothetical protein
MTKIDRVGNAKITADAKRLLRSHDRVNENTSKEKCDARFE